MTDPSALFATPRVAAGALFLDDRGWVLLVHPTYNGPWDIPVGDVERGESPELDRWEWVGLEQLDDDVIDRVASRIRAPILESSTVYLEHGRPVSGTSSA